MGTRSLIAVYLDGNYKVAQYSQWDGYPSGQGTTCLEFARDLMTDDFKKRLRALEYADRDFLHKLYRIFGAEDDGSILIKYADKITEVFPQFSRDTGAGILKLIQDGKIHAYLEDSITFAGDSLFCEWAWVIDLDKGTFEAYEGFNKTPLKEGDRFFCLQKEWDGNPRTGQYKPVRLKKEWRLDELPTNEEFVAILEPKDEE